MALVTHGGTSVSNSFVTMFSDDVKQAYQQMSSKLVDSVRVVRNVTGSTYKFHVLSKGGSIKNKARFEDLTAMSETFYMSNMSPMAASFNRGIWSRLEDWVREEALGNSGLYVVTGPILSSSCGSLKESITVPCAYYKIVFKEGTQPKMLGFVLSNAGASGSLQAFAVSVDEIEKQTGLDFFPQLDNALEQSLESKVSLSGWRF